MEEGHRLLVFSLLSGEISFWDVCGILGFCFLCWFVSYLLLFLIRKLPDEASSRSRNTLLTICTHSLFLFCGLFWVSGFPVSLCMAVKGHFDSKWLEKAFKAEEAKTPKAQLLESYRHEADSLRGEVSRLKRELHALNESK